jgi:hypothetical protein
LKGVIKNVNLLGLCVKGAVRNDFYKIIPKKSNNLVDEKISRATPGTAASILYNNSIIQITDF